MYKKGKNHWNWKNENLTYKGIHSWISREYGRASKYTCKQSDKTCKGRLEWSNISSEYKRDISDWQILCCSHHKRLDFTEERNLKISKAHTGKKRSLEQRRKMSESAKGKIFTKEHIQNMCRAQKKRWANSN